MDWLKRIFIRLLCATCRQGNKADSFLIPAYTGLGNFIMMSPMVLALRRIRPAAKILILAGNTFGTECVYRAGDGIVDDVLLLPQGASFLEKVRFFLSLRRQRIGTAFIPFDASPSFYWWGVLLAGIPCRVGHSQDVLGIDMGWTRGVLSDEVPLRLDTHESDLHFDLLERITGRIERDYATHMTAGDPEVLEKWGMQPRGYIAIQLAAANATRTPKLWPRELFAALIRRLLDDGETLLLPGDANERPLIDAFLAAHAISSPRIVNVAGRTTVEEVSTLLKFARLVVCHDSGLMHISNAHHTPLIALYGPTDDVFTMPRSSSSRMLRHDLPCAPCMKNFAKTEPEVIQDCPIEFRCMREISVDEVHAACRDALARST